MVTNTKKKTKKKTSKKATTMKNKRGVDIPIPKKIGRPSEYEARFCDIVVDSMSKGYSKEAAAGIIGISKNTLYEWAKRHKDLADALALGEDLSRVWWESKLVDYVVHSKNGSQINAAVFNLNMKNRFGWRDKTEISADQETRKSFGFSLDEKPEEL
jgi:hypothetical protein